MIASASHPSQKKREESVQEMNNRKVPGYDAIKTETLKGIIGRVSGIRLELCNKILR